MLGALNHSKNKLDLLDIKMLTCEIKMFGTKQLGGASIRVTEICFFAFSTDKQ